ncbi:MAG: transglycosylase SLT domain-containing protein [Pseudomonadota bacterium]
MIKMRKAPMRSALLAVVAALAVSACSFGPSGPPRDQNNICGILGERSSWGDALQDAENRWGAPPHVIAAIIWKESNFRAEARPPKKYAFFGLIPNGRVSSAYGYAQALDGTWDDYRDDTGNGWADRDDFDDAADFVGWYMSKTRQRNGLSMTDAYSQYLAYHEGHTGFKRGSWKSKGWLKNAASKVQRQAKRYEDQLRGCRGLLA